MGFNAGKVRKAVTNLRPYVPGKPIQEVERELGITGIVKLASNENVVGTSPKAQDAMREAVDKLYLYPENTCHYIKSAIAQKFGIETSNVICGNGAVEVIYQVCQVLIEDGDELVEADPSFMSYSIAGKLMGGEIIQVPLTADFRHDIPAMVKAITPRTKIVWICSPNNPTGTITTGEELKYYFDNVSDDVLTVIDEAYYDFVDDPEYPDSLEYLRQGRNVMVLRTMAKSGGIAGIRFGFGMTHPELVDFCERVRVTFSVNSLAQVAAVAALADTEHIAEGKRHLHSELGRLYACFDELGLEYCRTQGNFVWLHTGMDSKQVASTLMHQGVLIRPGWIFGHDEYIRVSVGRVEENDRFMECLRELIKGK